MRIPQTNMTIETKLKDALNLQGRTMKNYVVACPLLSLVISWLLGWFCFFLGIESLNMELTRAYLNTMYMYMRAREDVRNA